MEGYTKDSALPHWFATMWPKITVENQNNKDMVDRDAEKTEVPDYGYGWMFGNPFGYVPKPKELTPEEKKQKQTTADIAKAWKTNNC